jgi:hypothetical protein
MDEKLVFLDYKYDLFIDEILPSVVGHALYKFH